MKYKYDEGFYVVKSIPPTTMKEKLIAALHWTIISIGLIAWWIVTH